ncbi:MAG TPA: hypothetical protein VNF27_07870 [Candidatus Binataceae bacterium]|nr:hypothetical protein [Candidatus Binataceae bacterium]
MELRLMKTEAERKIFAERMIQARKMRGVGFCETPRSLLGRIHLAFGQIYGLFEENGESVERMMSGFRMHDLGAIPQSFPRPDMTHFPAHTVFECGELWSFSKGAGVLARRGAMIVAGLLGARAILVYPVVHPVDTTRSYLETKFEKVGEPVEFSFGQALDGGKLFIQPMVLEGGALETLMRKVFALGFETRENHTTIRFDNPIALKPSLDRPAFDIGAAVATPSAPENGHGEMNGNAHA